MIKRCLGDDWEFLGADPGSCLGDDWEMFVRWGEYWEMIRRLGDD